MGQQEDVFFNRAVGAIDESHFDVGCFAGAGDEGEVAGGEVFGGEQVQRWQAGGRGQGAGGGLPWRAGAACLALTEARRQRGPWRR